ncbi:MAG: hypothetical protein AAF517_00455 [Planctomycetota bacterium]
MKQYLRSWWGWTLVTLFVLIVGTAAWIRLDVAPPEDADLLIQEPAVPESKNGYFAFVVDGVSLEIRNPSVAVEDEEEGLPFTYEEVEGDTSSWTDMGRGRNWNERIATWVLDENRVALERLRVALERPEFRTQAGGARALLFDLPVVAMIAAHREARAGNWREAFRYCDDARELARRLRSGSDRIFTVLSGASCECSLLAGLREMFYIYEVPRDVLDEVASTLPVEPAVRESCVRGLKNVYEYYRRVVLEPGAAFRECPQDSTWFKRFGFRPNETLTEMAGLSRNAIRSILANDATRTFEVTIHNRLSGPNAYGRTLLDPFVSIGSMIEGCRYDLAIYYRFTRVFLAAERFRRDNDRLPKTLDELVGKYLNEVPKDPLAPAKQLRLRKDGVLYSVGRNHVDNGGRRRRSVARAEAARESEEAGADPSDEDELAEEGWEEDTRDDWDLNDEDDTSLELLVPDDRLVDYGLIEPAR